MTARAGSATLTRFVVASRYMPVYIAFTLLIAVAAIWVPNALSGVSISQVLPFGAVLGIAALGQMLVVMTAGIDLSTPATLTLAMVVMTGVGMQSDDRIGLAIGVSLGVAALIGLVNGILIGGFKLNALIVTLAVGQVVIGVINRYGRTFPVQSQAPPGWIEWTSSKSLGISNVFWAGLALTLLLVLGFRYTTLGRRFQVVGANPVASHVVGIRVNLNQILVYVVAALFYAAAGIALAGLLRTPGVAVNNQYLLGPIAAVVIGGASLTGGLASSGSTFVAAVFLTALNQLMRTMGLGTALQFVVFGLVIVGGMLVSGDRIIKAVERTLRDRRKPSTANEHETTRSIEKTG
jgi:ribose transport system permease protein